MLLISPHVSLPCASHCGLLWLCVQKLLQGIAPQARATVHDWQRSAARRLDEYFELDPDDNPLKDVDRYEAAQAYADLTAQQRCVSHHGNIIKM